MPEAADPWDADGVLRRIGPHADNEEVVLRIPVVVRGGIPVHAADGAAHVFDHDVRKWDWHAGIALDQDIDGVVAELSEVIRLEVIPVAAWVKMLRDALEGSIG